MNQKLNVLAVFLLLAVVTEYSITVLAQRSGCEFNGKVCSDRGRCEQGDNGLASYCVCEAAYHGQYCERTVPFCLLAHSQCQNGGKCIQAGDGYQAFCACKKPYYGQTCQYEEAQDKFCGNANPCQNGGKCIRAGDGVESGFCLCKKNYGGTYCENYTGSFCSESEPCKNGGQCVRAGDGKSAQCVCPQGYTGRLCEQSN